MYKRNYGGLLLQADPSSNIAYYSDDCFVKSCIRAPSNTTSSSVAPCTATETVLGMCLSWVDRRGTLLIISATTTQYTETASTTLTAVAYTTLDAPVWIETATNYIVQNVTAFDIVTVTRSVFSTITLPETTIVTSTSTEVDTVLVTSTVSTVYTSTSSLDYPLAANNVRVKPTCTGPPVSTVTTTSTQTNLMESIAPTTTTITITSTPEVVISTTTANITTNVPITTETAYFNTSVIVTRTQVVTTTLYAVPVTTTYQTSSILNTVSTTTTAYTIGAPTPTCPTSDGKIWTTQNTASGTNVTTSSSWTISCDQAYLYSENMPGGGTTSSLYDCIVSCAENRADYMATVMRRRGNQVMYCQAVQWNNATDACQWAYYAEPIDMPRGPAIGLDLAYLTNQR